MPIVDPKPPTPAGPYTVPLAKLADMLAETAAFQEQCGLTYPDGECLEKLVQGDGGFKRIYYPALDNDAWKDKLPIAVVAQGDAWRLPRVAGGGRNFFHSPDGTLELILCDIDRAEWSLEAGARTFMNWVGAVLASGDDDRPGLTELSALDDRLSIEEVSQLDPPALSPRDEIPYWTVRLQVTYGFAR